MLVQAPTARNFSLADSRNARRLKSEEIKALNACRSLAGDNVLAEQIRSLMPFVDAEDRAATAMQFIQAHRPVDEPALLPEWVQMIYS